MTSKVCQYPLISKDHRLVPSFLDPMKKFIFETYWKITRTYLRLRGVEVGRNVRCNGFPYVKIREGASIRLGDNVMINSTRWSNSLNIGSGCSFHALAGAKIIMEDDSGISGTTIMATELVHIGKNTLIGANTSLCDSDRHEIPIGSNNRIVTKPIRIGDNCFIGMNSIILKGVNLGDGSVVGAGSVVSRSIPPHCICAGNPASVIRTLLPRKMDA